MNTKKYRIKQYGPKHFEPQVKGLFGFWIAIISYNFRFDSLEAAMAWLKNYIETEEDFDKPKVVWESEEK